MFTIEFENRSEVGTNIVTIFIIGVEYHCEEFDKHVRLNKTIIDISRTHLLVLQETFRKP